ncbi:hypothetical protein Sango_1310400 [Sesamum angolense]|uniref:Uncharacterized protein n=1 Tax=Sesamum angolense TaxID=2727404 RepID=A0AAE1WRR5_9LAMI|nr:hypothetical protein Sango_1310400 [Sesamum angolense]
MNVFTSSYVYGSRCPSMVYIKHIATFLLCGGFCPFCSDGEVHCLHQLPQQHNRTARYFFYANFPISMPNSDIPVSSLFFTTNLLPRIFGPILMFLCSVITVGGSMNLDRNTTPLHQYKQ